MTQDQGALIPSGIILLWHGTVASIPSGWALCNGSNGTPDLRDKFVVCATSDSGGVAKTNVTGALTQTGGAYVAAWTHVTGGAHTLNSHTTSNRGTGSSATFTGPTTHSSDGGHTHDQHASNLNPYFALAFIMKL